MDFKQLLEAQEHGSNEQIARLMWEMENSPQDVGITLNELYSDYQEGMEGEMSVAEMIEEGHQAACVAAGRV